MRETETNTSKKIYREVSAGLTWQAIYLNKTINQYNADGTQNSYSELNYEGLTAFNLVNEKGNIIVSVPLGGGKKLFYRMRVALFVGSKVRERIFIVGWQTANNRQIWVVDSHGQTKTFKNWDEKSQWLYAPQFFPKEEPAKSTAPSPVRPRILRSSRLREP